MPENKITIQQVRAKKEAGEKLCVLTAYDSSFAQLGGRAGVDINRVGNSLANTVLGL